MHFTLNDRRYVVTITSAPIMSNGEPRQAVLDRRHRRILISNEVARHERRIRLFHELAHVFDDIHGPPAAGDEEGLAHDRAAFSEWIHEQYNTQGGDAVLEALNPEPERNSASEGTGGDVFDYRRCGDCNTPIAHGDVHFGEVKEIGGGRMALEGCWLECPADSFVTTWSELADANGAPTNIILPYPQPRVLRGREAAEWLRTHAQLCR